MTAPASTPNRYFMVDDNPSDLELILTALEDAGITGSFTTFVSGLDAKASLTGLVASGGPLPSHIFIDLNMPVCSGFDLLSFLKGDPSLKDIRAMILTTSNSPSDRKRCMLLGADDYLVKPTSFADLVAIMRGALRASA